MGRPPYTQWTETDHSGPVVIATILCLIYWIVPGLGQQMANLGQRSFFSWADGLYLASMLVGIIQSVVVLVAASHGLGKARQVLDVSDVSRALELYHASNILYVVVLGFAKCSAICSIISLTVINRGPIQQAPLTQRIVFGIVIAIASAWTIGSVAALGLQCTGLTLSSAASTGCHGMTSTWIGIAVADGITDCAVAAFAGRIIWSTRARRRVKLLWLTPFYLRLSAVVLSGARLATYHLQDIKEDPTMSPWLFVTLSQAHIFVSMISAGLPALKRAVLDLSTNFGVDETQSGSKKGYILSSLAKRSRRSQGGEDGGMLFAYSGRGSAGPSASVVGGKTDNAPSEDGDSQTGIVRRDDVDMAIFHAR